MLSPEKESAEFSPDTSACAVLEPLCDVFNVRIKYRSAMPQPAKLRSVNAQSVTFSDNRIKNRGDPRISRSILHIRDATQQADLMI